MDVQPSIKPFFAFSYKAEINMSIYCPAMNTVPTKAKAVAILTLTLSVMIFCLTLTVRMSLGNCRKYWD
jgi:hypothetical protein